jgi:hypothetical protein
MGVVVDVALVLVLPLRVLVRGMRMGHCRVVVLVGVHRHQVLHLSAHAALDVVHDVHMLMGVDSLLVAVLPELARHGHPTSSTPASIVATAAVA